jgi:hypothetical protein
VYYNQEQKPEKNFYNKERYENNMEEIFKNRREKYRTEHNKDLENIEVCKGTFTCTLVKKNSVHIIYNICLKWEREM